VRVQRAGTRVRKVLGLDLSITGTGLAHTVEGEGCTHLIKTNPKHRDSRLTQIQNEIRELAQGAELCLIEAPTPRSATSVISGMVQGVARVVLLEMGIPYGTLMPASLKKYATGRGTGDKIPMAIAALKRANREFPNDNEADAWWLWVAANDQLGQPVFPLPAINRESLNKIKMEG
jgi:Holliday junction resolvasome RuvABC endonuclease subunit